MSARFRPYRPIGIYDKIGGREAIEAIVEDLYVRVLADRQLSGFFAATNLDRIKGRQTEFFSAALGGPGPYTGAAMKDVHRGIGITMHHFSLFAGHLSDALAAAGIPSDTVTDILSAIAPLAPAISSGSTITAKI
jgi:hemoglobin